jgi:hypothetical protein
MIEREVALIAGLADERKGRGEGLKIYENGKTSTKMFCEKRDHCCENIRKP